MKKYISMLMIALVVLSCSKSDDDNDAAAPVIDHKIVGKWQYVAYMDDVAPFEWDTVEDGEVIEYKSNGYFEVNPDYSGCDTKTYEIVRLDELREQFLSYCNGELNATTDFEITDSDKLIFNGVFQRDKFIRIPIQE